METERRQGPRMLVTSPVFVSIGASKVGIVYDVGQGGLSIRGLIPKNEADFHFISFLLPRTESFIQARAEIAWTKASENRTGLRFTQLGEKAARDLEDFMADKTTFIGSVAVSSETVARRNTSISEAGFESETPITREILLSLVTGSSITVLLSVLRATRFAPELIDLLLRPGTLAARKTRGNGVVAAFSDTIIYGSVPFLVLRLRSWHRAQRERKARVDRRHFQRVALALPMFIYAKVRREPFFEATETINISATGGLIPVSIKMAPLQKVILTNMQTDEDSLCRVVRSVQTNNGNAAIGIELLQAPANFWSVIVSEPISEPMR
jgi:hypothetical protein